MKSKKADAEQVAKLMTLAREHPDGEAGAATALLDAAAMVGLEAGLRMRAKASESS